MALNRKQLGHLHHFARLSRQAPGDWTDMGPFDPTNEGDDAYRYQLAYMAYGLALAQYHHLPAYSAELKDTLERLIEKMMRQDVWLYWEMTSRGSKFFDPDLRKLGEGWPDPVRSKNIMYSGHLFLMVCLHEALYREGKYSRPGSLTFRYRPPLRGLGPEDFVYDVHSLMQVVVDQFRESKGLGCECEPNGIFVYCNQFPLLALKLYDHVYGTSFSNQLESEFRDAWRRRSNLFVTGKSESLPVFYQVKQDLVITEDSEDNSEAAAASSWGPLMHVWEKEYIESIYEGVVADVLTESDAGLSVSLERFHRTHVAYEENPSTDDIDPMMLGVHVHGMMALFAAEVGDDERLRGLLAHADAYMNPTWKDGGLFYPRNDRLDTQSYVTCTMGNALLGAARLLPKNGLFELFNHPWTDRDLEQPRLAAVDTEQVVVAGARFNDEAGELSVALLSRGEGEDASTAVKIVNLDRRRPLSIRLDGVEIADMRTGDSGTARVRWHEAEGTLEAWVSFRDEAELVLSVGLRSEEQLMEATRSTAAHRS